MSLLSGATENVTGGRTLFPYVARGLTNSALEITLRLVAAEGGTLVPVALARVPLQMVLETPLPRQAKLIVAMQEEIDERAATFQVPVESRVERGRTLRHAMSLMIEHEAYDRIVVGAAGADSPGFDPGDVAWLLERAAGEIIVLRAARFGVDERAARHPPVAGRPRGRDD